MFTDPSESAAFVQKLSQQHKSSNLQFGIGRGGWPEVLLKLANGSHATISLYGGHLLNWIDSKGREILFLSDNSHYTVGKAIRGGIPVIFPWFGKVDGTPQSHGFARNMFWNFESAAEKDGIPSLTLSLEENEKTLSQWPHAFRLELTYTLGDSLVISVKLKNTSKQRYTSQFALHTYFLTQNINNVQVRGLESCEFIDKARDGIARGRETSKALKFVGLVDRIYLNVPDPVTIHGVSNFVLSLESTMPDRVAWNPGKVEGAKLTDLPLNGYEKFVCVEAGAVENKVNLEPDAVWSSVQTISLQK